MLLRAGLALISLSEWQALLITSVAILVQMTVVKALSSRRIIGSEFSRKLLHFGTGLLFMLCWPLFPNTAQARYWAAALPAIITLRFLLVGLRVIKDQDTVNSMARFGRPSELLKGPLMYGIVFVASTILFWRDHPAGVTSLVLLCAGDGCAGLFGRGRSLPWSRAKSWRGFLCFIIASIACGWVYLNMFYELGLLAYPALFINSL